MRKVPFFNFRGPQLFGGASTFGDRRGECNVLEGASTFADRQGGEWSFLEGLISPHVLVLKSGWAYLNRSWGPAYVYICFLVYSSIFYVLL